MTQARYYSSTAVSTTITDNPLGSGATTMHVASTSGFPVSYPYLLILDPDTASEELVDVTAASGLTLTVTRGVDGTAAVQHSFGATVKHGVSARDYTDLQAHIAASSAVHGLTGSVVGTSDTQTLTGKTVNLASNTLSGTTAQFNTALSDNDFATLAGTETLTNKTLDTASGNVLKIAGTDISTAWTVDTAPNISNGTNWTLAAGSYQRYKQVGKTVYVELWAKCGADNTAGAFIWTLPVQPRDVTQVTLVLGSFCYYASTYHIGVVTPNSVSAQVFFRVNGGTANLGQGDGLFGHNGDILSAQLVYEVA